MEAFKIAAQLFGVVYLNWSNIFNPSQYNARAMTTSSSDKRQAVLEAVAQARHDHSEAIMPFRGAVAETLGLSASDGKPLLIRFSPLGAYDIARRTGLAAPSVAALIDRLERKGFARRMRDPKGCRRTCCIRWDLAVTLYPTEPF